MKSLITLKFYQAYITKKLYDGPLSKKKVEVKIPW